LLLVVLGEFGLAWDTQDSGSDARRHSHLRFGACGGRGSGRRGQVGPAGHVRQQPGGHAGGGGCQRPGDPDPVQHCADEGDAAGHGDGVGSAAST